jgi:hypothetical protein
MRRVPRREVLDTWLAHEWDKTDREEWPTALSDGEAFDALLTEKPGAAAFFWRDAPVSCYFLTLSRARFDRLHVVPGPNDLGWRALTPTGLVRECARSIDRGDAEELARETGIDIHAIEHLARGVPREPFVLSTRRGDVPWHVADGNHRAVATALALRWGERYEPVPAYLCIGANPVLGPLSERLSGLLSTLRRQGRGISKTQ